MTTYVPIFPVPHLMIERTAFRSAKPDDFPSEGVNSIPNWTAILFAVAVCLILGGLVWMMVDGDKRGAILAALGAGGAYLAFKVTERYTKLESNWKPL